MYIRTLKIYPAGAMGGLSYDDYMGWRRDMVAALTQSKAFDIFNDFEKTYVGLIYYAGLRRNEVLALTKKDIDFDNHEIIVNKTLSEDNHYHMFVQDHPKTNAGNRKIPISEPLERILLEYIDQLKDGEQAMSLS